MRFSLHVVHNSYGRGTLPKLIEIQTSQEDSIWISVMNYTKSFTAWPQP